MTPGLRVFLLLFFLLPLPSCAFSSFISKSYPVSMSRSDNTNWTEQSLVFCHRCVVSLNSFVPNRLLEKAPSNEIWSGRVVPRNFLETNSKRQLKGGLLLPKGIYDSKQLDAQMQNKTYKEHEDSANRFFYSLHRHLSDCMNFSLEIKLFYRKRVADKDSQLIDALKSEDIDLTISPVVTLVRKTDELFVDFLPAFQTMSYDIVLKQPRRIQSIVALSLQLRPEVWLCIGVLGLISAATFYVIQNIFARTHSLHYNEFSASECVLMVISAFAQQGIPITPSNISGRIVCAFVLVLGLMVSTYYNASTVNALLTHAPTSIKTVEQIIATGRQVRFQNDPLFHDPSTRSMVIKDTVWNSLPSRQSVAGVKSGMASVLEGNALCGERNALYEGVHAVFSDLEKCDVSFMPTSIPLLARSYVQRDSPHREMLFRGSLRLKEHGLIDRQYRHWFPPKPQCTANPKWIFVDLTIVTIAMGIVVFGLIASFVTFLFEFAYHALPNRKEHSS